MSDAAPGPHIVGIGASAGGLEALESFFDNMPASPSFACVVVQHLSPDYKSLMGELLAKHTRMPIHSAEDGMTIEPGSVYLIPRKKNMTVYKRKLFLTEQEHGLNLPIDIFLRSLAEDCGERAVGVILSGTGSDGTRGIRAIKEAGGLVIVQDEESAKFDGMPRSAISTGIVDFVLPPDRIPEELENFVSGNVRLSAAGAGGAAADSSAITKVFMLIKRRTGVDLSFYKESTIVRRIERRMGINQVHEIGAYVELLENSPTEVTTLFKEILIGVTKFFRDTDAFAVLGDEVIPALFNARDTGEPIRVWVAGCSTGEEAYSLAILMAEYAERHYLQNDIKIFATDIDKEAIEFASYGVYPESIAADCSAERLARYFVKKGEAYQIIPAIREMVIFAYHNVFKDPPFRRIDLISCRNLLIYLQPVLQKKVLSNFHFSLSTSGYLFLGSSETLGDLARFFRTVDAKWKVFAYKGEYKPRDVGVIPSDTPWRERVEPPDTRREATPRPAPPAAPIYESLLEDYLPPSVIVDENRALVHTFGEVNRFLKVPTGRMDLDIAKMAREELVMPLGTALQAAQRDGRTISYDRIPIRAGGDGHVPLTLTVRPLPAMYGTRYFAIMFHVDDGHPIETTPSSPFDLDESVRRRIEDLESELKYTKENLQATIEELETSNEELQATNEELLSSNEELQSTNEELQSVNEELITVNAEYQKKIEELSELNDDMDNLLSGTAIGTIFLDNHLTIRKFTPPVSGQINIIKSDVGRPFSDLSHHLHYDSLVADIEKVLRSRSESEIEVQHTDGSWYLAKIQPYRSEHDKVTGVVISLVDITGRKTAELALLRQHELLMRVLDSNPAAITMLDYRGRIIYANRQSETLLGFAVAELTSMGYSDPRLDVTRPDGAPADETDLPFVRILESGAPLAGYRLGLARGGKRDDRILVEINGNPIYGEGGDIEGAVLDLREIRNHE